MTVKTTQDQNTSYPYHEPSIPGIPAHEVDTGSTPYLHANGGFGEWPAKHRHRYRHACAGAARGALGHHAVGLARQAPSVGVQPAVFFPHMCPHLPVLLTPLNRSSRHQLLRALSWNETTFEYFILYSLNYILLLFSVLAPWKIIFYHNYTFVHYYIHYWVCKMASC